MAQSLAEFRLHFSALASQSSDADLNSLLGSMTSRKVSPGETVIKDGEQSSVLYFVMQGTLDCFLDTDGEKARIGRITPGQYIGEISMLDEGPATASVIADSECVLFELARPEFQALEKTHPVIASILLRNIIKLLIERLCASDQLLYDIFGEPSQAALDQASLSPREWVLRLYKRLSGYEAAKP